MAPLPIADLDDTDVLNRWLSAISSLFKSKSSGRPISSTSLEGIDSAELNELVIPLLLLPPPPIAPSELPAGSQLKPQGSEMEPGLGIPGQQNTDESEELVSNRWDDKHKRSGKILSLLP